MIAAPRDILERVFGYASFRGQQEAIIAHTITGGDSLVLMPTGAGKSLCYQVPALIRRGVTVVVSPLIALMQNQVSALLQTGARAAFLNSTLSIDAARDIETALLAGELDLLYVAPERLLNGRTLDLLDRCEVSLFAIDEAHCVSQWGHDFRPHYLQLSVLHERYPSVPRMALTATADEPTRHDIVERLALGAAEVFVSGFDRPNICYRVVTKDKARDRLLRFVQTVHPGDAGIVYCLSRRKVEETARWLEERGVDALPYHAGMTAEERARHQEWFLREDGVVMVATVAFGMGIDKSNVRFVAHLDLPKSMETYYQETGRAGRDGLPANAWLAYGLQDVITLRQMVTRSETSEAHKRLQLRRLDAMLGYCEVTTCRRQVLLSYFGDTLAEPCGNCDNCLEPVETWDATDATRKALSCVFRTGQRFGVAYIIDVLLGKDNERIRQFGHDRISTFGIGRELNAGQWRSALRQLIARGFLSVDVEGYGSLRLTEASRPVLRGKEAVHLRREAKARVERRTRAKPASLEASTMTEHDQRLWDAVRAHRRALAQTQGVPPYVIFHDATLRQMVAARPQTLQDFADISGVGVTKLHRYGNSFLDVIRRHASTELV